MAVTEPANLSYPGRNRDTEETAITNAAASEKGFPARTQGGDLVFIVKTERDGLQKVLVDADGNRYFDNGPQGFLVAYSSEELTDEDDQGAMSTPADVVDQMIAETASEVEAAVEHLDTQPLGNGDLPSAA